MSASVRIKQLNEQHGQKSLAARDIITGAEKASRPLNEEERGRLEALHAECDSIRATLAAEARQLAIESQQAAERRGLENQRDLQRFSLGRLIKRMAAGETLDGVEAEIATEGAREAREAGVTGNKGGVMVPLFAARHIALREQSGAEHFVSEQSRRETRDLTATTGTALQYGGVTVATDIGSVYDALMARQVLRGMGITVLEGLRSNLDLPLLVEDTDPAHKAENAQADEHTPTFAKLSLTPRRLPTVVEVSNQLFIQSEAAIETVVRRYGLQKLSTIMEKMWINGAGAGSNQPTGILNTVGIGAVAGGTNGAAPTWAHIVDLETEVAIDNADLGSLYYLTNAKVRGKLKKTVKVGSTDSMHIWDSRNGFLNGRPILNDHPVVVSNIVPSTLTKGTANSICSANIFGNFQDYIAGFWSGIEILLNPYSKDDYGLTRINFAVYYDGGVIRPQSFAAHQDILTT